jgi:MYXO-CTERM domain-containing protein
MRGENLTKPTVTKPLYGGDLLEKEHSFVDISASGSSTLVNNGYLMGIAESGDSGSAMWMDMGSVTDTNLWDYDLIGVTDTSTGGNFGDSNQYARVRNFSGWLTSTAYATLNTVTWDTSTAAGIQEGSGTWDLATADFSNGLTNTAWNNSTTQNVIFGAHQGPAGTVNLGANISVQDMMFDPTTSGTYTVGPGSGDSLTISSTSIITTNANGVISANIVGGGGTLTKLGTATLTLAGTNTFTGTLLVGDGSTSGGNINGALCVASSAALTDVSSIEITDNNAAYATFQVSGGVSTPSNVPFTWSANNAGPAATAGNIIENVSGTNTIGGAITYVVGGIGYGIVSDSGLLTIAGNLNPSGTSGKTFYLRGAGNGAFSGVLAGSGGNVQVFDSGTWTLNSANTYTGVTTLAGGVLSTNRLTSEGSGATGSTASGIGQSNNSAANLVFAGGTLSYTGTGVSTDRLFSIGPGGGAIDSSGTGALVFTNTGSDLSTDAVAHNGSTNSGSNVVSISSAGMTDLAIGEVVTGTGIPAGDTIAYVNDDAGTITLNSPATATGTPSLTFGPVGRTLTLTGTSLAANTIDSTLSDSAGGGPLSLAKSGLGSWTINSVNSYSGSTTVNVGTLTISPTATIGTSSPTIGPIGNLINDGSISAPSLNNSGVVVNNNSLTITNTFTNSGTFYNNTTFSQTSTLNASGNITNTGTTTIGGAQYWSPGGTFTNTSGITTFQTDADGGSPSDANLSVSVSGGSISLTSDQHWAGVTLAPASGNSFAGTLDVENNRLFIHYGGSDPISSIISYLDSGYAGGAWTGTGIISSTAAANARYSLGYADSADAGDPAHLAPNTIEVEYTLLGDANLDGVVNAIDFGILAANFNKGVTGWDQGDFNYDNVVNAIDFGDLAANFNRGAVGVNESGDWAALDAFAAANGLLADVPEPAGFVLAGVGAAGLLRRRRRMGR